MPAMFKTIIWIIIYKTIISTAALTTENETQLADIPERLTRQPQVDVNGSHFEQCTSFKYSTVGLFGGCGYSFDIFRLTRLQNQDVTILQRLSLAHLNVLNKHFLHSAKFDIWTAANVSFAFESGTSRLFTAWGPELQLRPTYSSEGFVFFENVHPTRPSYSHKCAPFCKLLQIEHAFSSGVQSYHSPPSRSSNHMSVNKFENNHSVVELSDYTNPFVGNQLSSGRQYGIKECESCAFLGSDGTPLSCDGLLENCLNADSSSSCGRTPPRNSNSSFFCLGLYYLFLSSTNADCPKENINNEQVFVIGVCDSIYDALLLLSGKNNFEVTFENVEMYSSSRELISSEKREIQPEVKLRVKTNDRMVLRNAIDKALDLGRIRQIDVRHILWEKSKESIECNSTDRKKFKLDCTAILYFPIWKR